MNAAFSVTHSLEKCFSDFSRKDFSEVVEWLGRTVQHISRQMQTNRQVAWVVFAVANSIFFALSQCLVNYLDRRIESHPTELNQDEKYVKHVLLSGIFGGCIYLLNDVLCQASGYPIRTEIKVAIAVTAVGARLLINYIQVKIKNRKNVVNPPKDLPITPKTPNQEKVDPNKVEDGEKIDLIKEKENVKPTPKNVNKGKKTPKK